MNFNTELEISNKASSEENIYLKNRVLSLEKTVSRLEILLSVEKAVNISVINELKDKILILESHIDRSKKNL
jgi:hypothetical protein